MTPRRPRPQAPPLADTLRAALAQGWHTLDALEALAGRATGARLRVHAALAELRAAGVVLEERVERGVAEVRLLTLPAPVPDDPRADLDATIVDLAREAQEMGLPVSDGLAEASDELGLSEEDTERLRPVWVAAFERRRAEREEAERALDAPDPLREPSPPVEDEPVDAASYYLGRGREEEDADLDAVRAARGRALRERVIASLPPGATPREIMFAEAKEIVRMRGPVEPATALDAPASPCEPSAPVEAADAPAAARREPDPSRAVAIATRPFVCLECGTPTAERTCPCGGEVGERPLMGAAPPKDPGPGSRCARPGCGKRFDQHGAPRGTVCPFVAKPRGRPRVAALDATPVESAGTGVGAEPETSRGGSEETSDDATRNTDGDRPTGGVGVGSDPVGWQAVADEPSVPSESAHPVAPRPRKARTVGRPVESTAPAGVVVKPCRPPLCHADDIHVPSAVRGFARPLCERHRAWVEEAGGTLAAGGLAGVVPPAPHPL